MGFSLTGALLVAAILAPNLLMLVLPPKNAPGSLQDAHIAFTILERLGQAGCFVIPCISRAQFQGRDADVWLALAIACIAVYWGLWTRYALTGRAFYRLFEPLLFIPVPMAVFPVLAFLFAAIWSQSLWLGVAAALLAIGHLANSGHVYRRI